jgi:hypothetical protein
MLTGSVGKSSFIAQVENILPRAFYKFRDINRITITASAAFTDDIRGQARGRGNVLRAKPEMKTRQSQATIYKPDRAGPRTDPHHADACPADRDEINPVYRGFKLNCLAAELLAKQRAIDAFWTTLYFETQTQAGREAVIAQEKEWRDAPREWA